MTTSLEEVQSKLDSVKRHGYALYEGDLFISWVIDLSLVRHMPRVTRAVNVQNGGYFEYRDGYMIRAVRADAVRSAA